MVFSACANFDRSSSHRNRRERFLVARFFQKVMYGICECFETNRKERTVGHRKNRSSNSPVNGW